MWTQKSTTMKRFLLIIPFALITLVTFGQSPNIQFDYDVSTFSGNTPLPSGERFQISGPVSKDIEMVEISVYKEFTARKGHLYTANWRRGLNVNGTSFTVPMQYKLRPSEEYDFTISYFKKATTEELQYLNEEISTYLNAYFNNIISEDKKSLDLSKSSSLTFKEVEKILESALLDFRNLEGNQFEGLSDLFYQELGAIDRQKIEHNKNDSIAQHNELNRQINELIELTLREVQQFTNKMSVILIDKRFIENYETEDKLNTVAINVGYAGVWMPGGSKSFEYDGSPYVGVSIPFGKKDFAKPFWNNLSISTGVFLLNMTDGDDNTVSGPIIKRPFYVGLGYKLFRFVKLNAGATVLETQVEDGGFINVDQITVRPFVGLSIEFDFWMDFAK